MPVERVDSGRSSSLALEFAQFMDSIAFEVPVKHGHSTKAESFDVF